MDKRKQSKKKSKFRFLLDSAFAKPEKFPKLSKKANLAHPVHDLVLSPKADDEDIYQKAVQEKRFILTINFKDFKNFVKKGQPGVFGIESELSNDQIDEKVTEFLSGKDSVDFIGKVTKIP